jgi:A/G-specific adenine glycosylase
MNDVQQPLNDFTPALLKWFDAYGRELPWRQTRDPYAVWLSEIILQQTRVEQGRPYWERFMQRWPTAEALARASEDEVLRQWQGLGYYSRARNLHFAAGQIVAMGGFPQTIEGIRSLKGVGDYTAAAIGSIAFDLPVAVVDGNVYRVLARHFGIDTPINTTEGKKEFTALAQSLLPPKEASRFNQAMMDFGATQCTPQSPRCLLCPLQDGCVALREGRVGQLPVKLKTLKVKERRLTYIYIRCQGQTAIRRRPAGDIWQGLYEPLSIDGGQLTVDNWAAQNHYPLSTANCQLLRKNVRHVLTHRILYADFYLWEPDEQPSLPSDYIWIPESDIDNYALPRLIEVLLELVHA